MQANRLEVSFTCRQVIQEAEQILALQGGFSSSEAHLCLFELAQAGKNLIIEVASHIVDERCALPGSKTEVGTDLFVDKHMLATPGR